MTTQRRQRPTRATDEQQVTFPVSPEMLRTLLRLAPDVTVTGARIDRTSGDIVFTLDAPRAPKNATGLTVQYLRVPGKDTIMTRPEWQYAEPEPGLDGAA